MSKTKTVSFTLPEYVYNHLESILHDFMGYPDVDVKVSQIELEKALEKSGILKYEYDKDGNVCEYYDIEGFKNCFMANQVKEQILEEYDYKNFSNDFNISSEEMDKVKVKVKTMVRK